MKILVNTPNIYGLGGVSNHFLGLKPYWTQNVLYNSLGSKKWRKWIMPFTVIKYILRLIFFRPDIVLVNPSLGRRALVRDFFYMRIAKKIGYKAAVFIHGFDMQYAQCADWKWISDNLNRADCVIVLAQAFKDELISHGVKTDIYLSTTKVMDALVDGYDVSHRSGKIKNLLFLSRIEKAKGVYETVETFEMLRRKYADLTLTFVGDGSELASLKQHVAAKNLGGVRFTGALSGEELKAEYVNADIFVFFSYGEGMPTVVLEAMAFGLPVITRSVGGLCDFFEDGKMGRITDSMSPKDYVAMIEPFINDRSLTQKVSLYNYQYAKEHFMASKVAKQVENILEVTVNNKIRA